MILCLGCRRGSFRRSLLCVIGLIILSVLVLRADAAVPGKGIDPTLDGRLERLIEQLEKQREAMNVPGMAIAVVKNDEVILSRGFGLRDIENNLPATDETHFAIGSSSKAFTSALVAMMIDDEMMSWDDPLRKHLPRLKLHDEEVARRLTLRDALSHRTGLGRTDLLWVSGQATPHEILEALASAELQGEFRKHFGYNNPMYLAVGLALESATGKPWGTLIDERIFNPLGMTSSDVSVAVAQQNPHMATGYQWDEDTETFEKKPMRSLDTIAPAGAINSNVRDMAQWLRLMLGRGEFAGNRLLSEKHIEEMWTPHIEMAPSVSYGLGWMVREWRGKRLIEHGGNIDGFAAQVALLPDDGVGFVLLTNATLTPLAQASIEFVFDALLGEPSDDGDYPGAAELQKYLGKYRFELMNDDMTVLIKDGKLAVNVPGQMAYTLLPPDEDGQWQFEMTDQIKVEFVINEDGNVVTMKMHQAGMTFEMPREGAEQAIKPEVELADVADYLGTYEWPLGAGKIEIKIHNGRLAADIPGQMVYELHLPNDQGKWVFRMTDTIGITFNRAGEVDAEELGVKAGEVVALTINQAGARTQHRKLAGVPEAALPAVDELVERVMKAHGVSTVRPIQQIVIEARFRMVHQGISGTSTVTATGLDAYRQSIDLGRFGSITVEVNSETGVQDSTFSGREELAGRKLLQARMGHPLSLFCDWRTMYDEITIRSMGTMETDDHGERRYIRVELVKDDFRRTIRVDAESWRILGERYSEQIAAGISLPKTYTYLDHRPVGGGTDTGLILPFRSIVEDEITGKTITELTTVEVN